MTMKATFIFIALLLTTLTQSQTKFTFNENGLTPKSLTIKTDTLSETELYTKTLQWITATYKNPEKTIVSQIEGEVLQISGIKDNAIKADKRYFHLKYAIKINFKNQQYTFEPLSIETKANSKYDMGWKNIDLKNGSDFFKKGKPIKKTKSYVKVIPKVLTELNTSLYNYLIFK